MTLFGFYYHVIDVYLNIFVQLILQAFLHASLICCTCISQSEWHGTIAISPVRGDKRCLYLIIRIQWYLMESRIRVHKRQQLTPSSRIYDLVDPWQGKWIFWTRLIEVRVINTHAPYHCHVRVIFLLLDQDWI